jgi:uncharacterized coiled-coil protein SlyX|nr:MAG TPA: Protein of unknown function (DUF2570) [Caudoviricetes sp.]
MGIFDKFCGFLSKYVFPYAKLILVMFILLMLYKIDIVNKRNEELKQKLEVTNVTLKGKEEQIKLLEEKAATQDQLITNYKQSIFDHQAKIAEIEKSANEHTKALVNVLDKDPWANTPISPEAKEILNRKKTK